MRAGWFVLAHEGGAVAVDAAHRGARDVVHDGSLGARADLLHTAQRPHFSVVAPLLNIDGNLSAKRLG